MIAFKQKYFPWIESCYDWWDNNSLRYQHHSINKKVDRIIPLSSIHPHPVVVKRSSRVAGLLAFLALGCMFMFGQDYLNDTTSWKGIEIVAIETTALIAAICSGFYYWFSGRRRIFFYFNDMRTVAFALLDKSDKKLNEFKEELIAKSLQAIMAKDEYNIALLKKEISRLTRQGIINKEFEDVLHERLSMMTINT